MKTIFQMNGDYERPGHSDKVKVRKERVTDLRNRCLLVTLNTSMFGIERLDKEATKALSEKYGCDPDMVKANASRINPKNSYYAKVKSIRGLMGNTFRDSTSPWGDGGQRIISAKGYTRMHEKIDELIAEFYSAVEKLIGAWDEVEEEAKRKLAGRYCPELRPTPDEVRKAFHAELVTEVMPDRRDIRLDLDDARIEKIRKDATERDRELFKQVTDATFQRVHKALTAVVEGLDRHGQEKDGLERKQSFKDSLINNMADLADALPGLNISGDPKLARLARDIAAKLTVIKPEELREDENGRSEVKTEAKQMLADLSATFGQGDSK